MDIYDIDTFAYENSLNVKKINDRQLRLSNKQGVNIFDIYFKRNKHGKVTRNSVLRWGYQKWFYIHTVQELKELL